jgi:superkiller protein 3
MRIPFYSLTLLVPLGFLAGCGLDSPAPLELNLGGTTPEASVLIGDLERAVAADPRNASNRGELGLALEANGMPKAAVQAYGQAEELDASDPRWSYMAAVLLAQLGELDEAVDAVDRSLALDPTYVPAHLYRGAWLLDLGRLDEAREAYELATRLQLDSRAAWYGRARVHLRREESAQALAILERLATSGRTEPYLQQLLGLAYRETGDLERAREALAAGRGEQPPSWPDPRRRVLADYARGYAAEKRRGDVLIESNRWQEAAATLEPLLRNNPMDLDLFNDLALVYRNLNRHDESIRLLETGLGHDPTHLHLRVNRSVAHEQRGELESAIEQLDLAIESNPTVGFVQQRKGILLLRLRRIEEAVTAFERAVLLDSRDRVAHVYLGIALVEARRWDEAAKRLELALKLDPTHGDALGALAYARMELGEFDHAERTLEELERVAPRAPQTPRLRERLAQKKAEAR